RDAITFTCPQDEVWIADPGQCHASGIISEPIVNNLCGRIIMEQIKGPDSGEQLPVGCHEIVYQLSNGVDAPEFCRFSITVKDVEAPQFVEMKDTTIYLKPNETF